MKKILLVGLGLAIVACVKANPPSDVGNPVSPSSPAPSGQALSAVINSFPGMSGLIVYRAAGGKPAIAMTKSLEGRFHRIASTASRP